MKIDADQRKLGIVHPSSGIKMHAMRRASLRTATNILIWAILIAVLLDAIIPFAPEFPAAGLDNSWHLGLNYAIAHHLQFGKQIAFTFGPYAPLYTQTYTPGTAVLMFSASAYLAMCYILGFACIWQCHGAHKTLVPFALMSIALVAFPRQMDAIFMLYPILCVAAIVAIFNRELPIASRSHYVLIDLLITALFMPLGLISIIKSSFAVLSILASVISCVFLAHLKRPWYALFAIAIPLLALAMFWCISGQHLSDLPAFAKISIAMISGYTNAMSLVSRAKEMIPFFVSALAILVMAFSSRTNAASRLTLMVLSSLVIFLSFKEGYVRQSAHVLIAADELLMLAVILTFFLTPRVWLIPLIVVTLCTLRIDRFYTSTHFAVIGTRVESNFISAYDGIAAVIEDNRGLVPRYRAAMSDIRASNPLPLLKGTSDIYPVDISTLLASGNTWNPRPVFQSYSAYTPALSKLNALHLQGAAAPSNVFFAIGAIDRRFPSLGDGASWPALLTKYSPRAMADDFVVLRRQSSPSEDGALTPVTTRTVRLGTVVQLPTSSGSPLFAELVLKQTVWGHLLSVLFKPPELRITVWCQDGSKRTFRLIAGMARTPFLLSPLIVNTDQFLLLYTSPSLSFGRAVKAIRVTVADGSSHAWGRTYTLKLSRLVRHGPLLSATVPIIDHTLAQSTGRPFRPYDGGAAGGPDNTQCALDAIDQKPAANAKDVAEGASVIFGGWAGNRGERLARGLLVLKDSTHSYAVPLVTGDARPDVAKAFKSEAMARSGFNTRAMIDRVAAGRYEVLIASAAAPPVVCDTHRVLTIR